MRLPRMAGGLCLILALFAMPSSGVAQLGGLVKKAKEKVAPSADQSSTDQPARLPGPTITPEVVNHFLSGLKTEKDTKDRAAAAEKARKDQEAQKQMTPEMRYYACMSDHQQKDTGQATITKLGEQAQAAAKAGDNQKAMQYAMQLGPLQAAIQQRAEAACAPLKSGQTPAPTPEQQAVIKAPEVSPEAAGAKAAGLSEVEYGQVKELIYTYLNAGKRAGVSPAEQQAIEARRADLKAGFAAIGM